MAKTLAVFDGKSPSGLTRTVKVRYYPDLYEYAAEVWDNGKRRDDLDYFTCDKADAFATGADMVGHTPRL